MTQRVHKVLLDAKRNHFSQIDGRDGKPLDLNAAAEISNSKWPPYTEVCLETWELYPHEAPDGTHQHWVLRANVRCCCAGACGYASDHAGNDAYAKVAAAAPSSGSPATTPHGPAQGYVEARLDMGELAALAAQARAVANDPAARAALGESVRADAYLLELTAAEIEGELGIAGVDANGLLSTVGAVAAVGTGASTSANDIYCVAAAVKLHQRLVHAVHNKLAQDWPQQGVAKPIRLGQRQQGGAQ